VEFALVPPISPGALGADPHGGRVDATWRMATAAVVVARRGTVFDSEPDVTAPTWDPPAKDLLLVRLRGDALRWGGLRLGGTWKRWHPDEDFATGNSATDARTHDLLAFDLRAGWHGILGSAEISDSHASGLPADASGVPVRPNAGPLTRALPATAAFRAELRTRSQSLGRWGAIGFAPQYRALGAQHVDRAGGNEPDLGRPRRGLEGYRLEAWYELPGWPAWARHAYDRHQQFRDADRRVIAQLSEVRVQATSAVHVEARYAQQDERLPESGERFHHDDLVAAVGGADSRARFRLQGGMLDLGGARERSVLVLETDAPLGSRMQVLSRVTSVDEAGRTRTGFFAALQYWHLPEFELEVEYGPGWLGDAALPALDGDLTADGHDVDRFRLHFRGWF
jgi:hypothetical protein